MVPPGASAPLAESVDQLLLETTNRLFGFELDATRAALMQRRLGDGGLGLRRRGGPHAAAAWLASWAQCYKAVHAHTSWEFSPTPSVISSGSLFHLLQRAAEDVRDSGARGAAHFLDGST